MKSLKKVITFEKSALKDLCKMLNVKYDKNIIAFTKKGTITNIWDLLDEYTPPCEIDKS